MAFQKMTTAPMTMHMAIDSVAEIATPPTELPTETAPPAKKSRGRPKKQAAETAPVATPEPPVPAVEPTQTPEMVAAMQQGSNGKSIDVAKIAKAYISERNRKEAIMRKAQEECAEIEARLDKAEAFLLKHMQSQGVDSMKTPHGTCYIVSKVSAKIADWDVFLPYVIQHEQWQLLERRVGKVAAEQFKEVNKFLPPGINYSELKGVNVRKS